MTISATCPKCSARRLFVTRQVLDWFDVVCDTCDERLLSLADEVRKAETLEQQQQSGS